ncbi:MAG TPA: outer membrane protein assembly factor BamB [Povalibacter sp.]|jgi:outer membrane protein assembly factor BamB|nr:outer membrane protein assembly factor BamB [Povalibacter sp.]
MTHRSLQCVARGLLRSTILVVALIGIAACDKDKDPDPPAKLVDLVAKANVNVVWSDSLGGASKNLRLALRPVAADGVVYAASHDGDVVALTDSNGRRKWSVKTKLPLAAGPAAGNGVVVVGSSDGDVVVLDAATGQERWRQSVASEILARPLITPDLVVIRTVDGHLEGLSLTDGSRRWAMDEQLPRLSLRGTAPPVLAAGDRVIAGFDNGRIVAVDVRNGDVLWDTIVNAPHGRTELERLADIDSAAHVVGDDVYVVGFQGRIAMLSLDSGQIWWARDASSYRGFSMDDDNIYLTTSEGLVTAMRRTDGSVQWEQSSLRRRGLTAPTIDGDLLVVGDFQGYVHWLDKATGEVVARHKTDGDRISNAATEEGGRVYVQTDAGKLIAFKTTPKAVKSPDAAG